MSNILWAQGEMDHKNVMSRNLQVDDLLKKDRIRLGWTMKVILRCLLELSEQGSYWNKVDLEKNKKENEF